MPRIRTIKPTFFRSRAVRRLSSNDVRIVWVGLWPLADDHGRLLDEPDQLAGDLWALELTAEQIDAALTELHDAGRVHRYEVDGERFIQVTNWHDHQKINRPNDSEIPPAPLTDESVNAHGALIGGREGKGKEGRGGLTPFCPLHPGGTRQKCGPCGDARRAFDLAQKTTRDKPTIVGIVTEPDCPKHPHRPLRGCDRCAEEAAA